MEVYVNEDCIYCALCADLCPEVFQLADDRAIVALDEIPPEYEDCCREAAAECPSDAIEIKE